MIGNIIHDLVRARNDLELRLCEPSLSAKERSAIEQRVASIRADIEEERAAIGKPRYSGTDDETRLCFATAPVYERRAVEATRLLHALLALDPRSEPTSYGAVARRVDQLCLLREHASRVGFDLPPNRVRLLVALATRLGAQTLNRSLPADTLAVAAADKLVFDAITGLQEPR